MKLVPGTLQLILTAPIESLSSIGALSIEDLSSIEALDILFINGNNVCL